MPPVQVIGDKNGGLTTLMFIADHQIGERHFSSLSQFSCSNISIKVIHVICNPYDNIATRILYMSGGVKKIITAIQKNKACVIDVNKIKYYIDEYFNMFQAIQLMKSNYDLDYIFRGSW